MEKNVVMIDLDRYNELIVADAKLKTLKMIAEQDKNEYGYSKITSGLIDGILDIEREGAQGE